MPSKRKVREPYTHRPPSASEIARAVDLHQNASVWAILDKHRLTANNGATDVLIAVDRFLSGCYDCEETDKKRNKAAWEEMNFSDVKIAGINKSKQEAFRRVVEHLRNGGGLHSCWADSLSHSR